MKFDQSSVAYLEELATILEEDYIEMRMASESYTVCLAESESEYIEYCGGIKQVGSNESERSRNLLLHTTQDDGVIASLKHKIAAEAKYKKTQILIDAAKLLIQLEIANTGK